MICRSKTLFANMSFLVVTGVHAYGRIVRPSLINGTLYLCVVPISYVAFLLGGDAWTSYLFNVLAVTIGMLSNVYTLHKYIPDYSITNFLISVFFFFIFLLAFGFLISYLPSLIMQPSFYRLISTTLFTLICVGILGWFMMLSAGQRSAITNRISLICKRV